jgi:hypothetical protein
MPGLFAFRGVCMISRRHFMAGSAAAAGLASALAGPALAIRRLDQTWTVEAADAFGEVYEGRDGMFASVIDPVASPGDDSIARVALIRSAIDPSIAFFETISSEVEELRVEAPEAFGALRSLGGYRTDAGRRMMGVLDVANAGGPGGVVESRVEQTAAQYQATISAAAGRSLEPVWIQVDNVDGAPRFHTLYRRVAGAWEARHGVKPQDLTALTTAMTAKGLRLARMAPYYDGGALRFAVLFRASKGLAWEARIGLNSPREIDTTLRLKRYSLLQASQYNDGGYLKWACIWQNQDGVTPDLFWGV